MAAERSTTIRRVALIPIALIVFGCGDNDGPTDESTHEAWGPLAVVARPRSGNDALIAGSLGIGESCVIIREGADEHSVLLVWPSEGTTWKSESNVIEYNDGERTVELADGDEVSFGGGGDSVDEGGLSAGEWVASIDGWVSEPDPSCSADVRWFVGGLLQRATADS